METFVVRLWLPDRPGALGAVASRIGAVRGDVVGIEILERGADRVVDELVVQLPDATLVPLLVTEVSQVDGVDIEAVRPLRGRVPDPRLESLETVEQLLAATSDDGLLRCLVDRTGRQLEADWCAVIDPESPWPLAVGGALPPLPWLRAFVAGSRASAMVAAGQAGPDDVACALLESAGLGLVVGRVAPFRGVERQQVAALARIADGRLPELGAARQAS